MAHDNRRGLTDHLDESRRLTADFLESRPNPNGEGTLADGLRQARADRLKAERERLEAAELAKREDERGESAPSDREVSGD